MGNPALLDHCITIWNGMDERAEDKLEGRVYEGFLTGLFNELGLNTPYYTAVRNQLVNMDCMRLIKRGGGPTPSKWLLMQAPTIELFEAFPPSQPSQAPKLNKKANANQVMQMVRDLGNRVANLEDQMLEVRDDHS